MIVTQRSGLCFSYTGKNIGLVGSLPSEMGNMASLEKLDISDTGVSGPIPTEFGLLSALEDFHAGKCCVLLE